jgi:hypothetical protein
MTLYQTHLALMGAEDAFVPKHHLMFHLLSNAAFLGNPRRYSTWLDESLNKLLKATCRHASQAVFEASTLLRMRELLAVESRKRQRE